jgi:hypothetical protein
LNLGKARCSSSTVGFSAAHFQAKHALGLDLGVDTGSPSENATTQREKSKGRLFYQNGIRSNFSSARVTRRAPLRNAFRK